MSVPVSRSNIGATYRRVNKINFNGDRIRSFRDETGLCIWVAIKDLLTNIGIHIADEHERLSADITLIRELQINKIAAYLPNGDKIDELFIPHMNINQYLFSFPSSFLKENAVYGNLRTYQSDFLVVLNQYWTQLEGSAVSYSPLELRRAVVECSVESLKRSITSLSSYAHLEGDDADQFIQSTSLRCIVLLKQGLSLHSKTNDQMSAVELDALSLSLTLLSNELLLLQEIGTEPNQVTGLAIRRVTVAMRSPIDLSRTQLAAP